MIVDQSISDDDIGSGSFSPVQAGAYDPVTGTTTYATQSFAGNPIFIFYNKLGRYPGNNKQWFVGRASVDDSSTGVKAGDFQPQILETFFSGNNQAPRGHYILDQFHKDRSLISGVSNIPIEDTNERPSCVAFFSGRAWYGCQSTVYFSQILDSHDVSKAGKCYQDADPTAEDISDLIASDGGVIPIPESSNIVALEPIGNGLMVFANNGVWFVSGGDSAFSATTIAVSKVSPIGTKSPNSIVHSDTMLFWWSEIGIQAVSQVNGSFGAINGRFNNENIAETTIQSFYNGISDDAKHNAKGILDPRNNLVIWLYNSEDVDANVYDSMLLFDITLGAFYPWKITSPNSGPQINGVFLDSGYLESVLSSPITDAGIPITNSGTIVSTALNEYNAKPSNVFYLTQVPGSGLTVSAPISTTYTDWQTFDGTGASYDSYITTGYELLADAMREKQAVYVVVHFNRTDDNLGNNPSSCMMTTMWDWAGSSNPNKWSKPFEAYRPRTINLTDVVVSKSKVRGSGRALQFKFGTSEPGKTFDLLGWSVEYSGNTQP